jgi:hypothetical protein
MAQGALISKPLARTESSRSSSHPRFAGADLMVSLRQLKAMAQGLDPGHPLRVLIMGEPDEIPRREYATKVVGWFRLIVTPAGSARPDGR